MGKIIGSTSGPPTPAWRSWKRQPKVIETSEGSAPRRPWSPTGDDGECWSASRPSARPVTNPKKHPYAIKRLVGRRAPTMSSEDIKMVPYTIVKADNGDAGSRRRPEMAAADSPRRS